MTKSFHFFVFGLLILTLTSSASSQADAPPGAMKLLPRYIHKTERGIDTRVGSISKPDGLTIKYDIGRLAGQYANPYSKNEYVWYKEQIVGGQKVVCVLTKQKQIIATFTDSSANFFATVETEEDVVDFLLMVLTFEAPESSPPSPRRRTRRTTP